MQKQLDSILHKDMTRKEFFLAIGYGLAALAGISTMLQLLGKDIKPLSQLEDNARHSYGISAYGR